MIKVVAIVLAGVVLVSILGSATFMGIKIGQYMVNQNFSFRDAWEWSLKDLNDWIESIRPKSKQETIVFYPFANQYVDVVACTAL